MRKKRTLPHPISLVVFDFDGVFTDNKVYISQEGSETIMCDRRDGLGLEMLKEKGVDMFILSMETNPVVKVRARKLGLNVEQGCDDKAKFLTGYLVARGIDSATVIYMGNDLNDLGAMKVAGYAVAPADAHPAVLETADLVVTASGGNGAVRELCEFILKNRGDV